MKTLSVKLYNLDALGIQSNPLSPQTTNNLHDTIYPLYAPYKPTLLLTIPTNALTTVAMQSTSFFF